MTMRIELAVTRQGRPCGTVVTAAPVILEGLELALHTSVEEYQPGYTVTDPVTGAALGKGQTHIGAINSAKQALARAAAYHKISNRADLLARLQEEFYAKAQNRGGK